MMESAGITATGLAEKPKDKKFLRRVKALRTWLLKNPYDLEAHSALASLYLSVNMFAEAEYEQEIMEWLDRIKRSVKHNY